MRQGLREWHAVVQMHGRLLLNIGRAHGLVLRVCRRGNWVSGLSSRDCSGSVGVRGVVRSIAVLVAAVVLRVSSILWMSSGTSSGIGEMSLHLAAEVLESCTGRVSGGVHLSRERSGAVLRLGAGISNGRGKRSLQLAAKVLVSRTGRVSGGGHLSRERRGAKLSLGAGGIVMKHIRSL